ncbi:chromosomal replication initiator protein DnaA [Candidatus Amarolinea aalborgensis]|uniref:chromosomal replication initiator protein DnaA n=1 Tax=Candidatus Amarolinea aalborgensis TaxID=2249329 RepID=UPI003BF95FE4
MSGIAQMTSSFAPAVHWQAALGELKLQMPRATFDTWVKDTTVVGCNQDEYTIGVPNAFAKDWLENRLGATMRRTLAAIVGRRVDLRFVVRNREPLEQRSGAESPLLRAERVREESPRQESAHSNGNGSGSRLTTMSDAVSSPPLNPRHTFEAFIVGSGNRLAHAVSQSVAEKPGEAYNPLFLYGDVGLGKTHLLQAIAHDLQRRGLRVIYVSSEAFTNDLIGSLRTQSTEAFRERYRTCDALLIDDIQFIADKERTQEEFFHTFNALYAANRQLVLSSDRPPRSISLLEDRLRSRFEGGLTADIKAPDLETRVAILQARANSQPMPVPADVLMLIAHRVQTNIRELEGAFTRVVAQAQLLHRPITTDLAERILSELAPARAKPTSESILTCVCAYYQVERSALLSTSRARSIVWPRHVAMYLLRSELDLSLPQIGRLLGDRDHTTVMHGVEKVTQHLAEDETIRKQLVEVREQLLSGK